MGFIFFRPDEVPPLIRSSQGTQMSTIYLRARFNVYRILFLSFWWPELQGVSFVNDNWCFTTSEERSQFFC